MSMNRREALQAGLSVLAACKIDGEVATISPKNPQAFVITMPFSIGDEMREKLDANWKEKFANTPLANVPLILMQGGMELSVIDDERPSA